MRPSCAKAFACGCPPPGSRARARPGACLPPVSERHDVKPNSHFLSACAVSGVALAAGALAPAFAQSGPSEDQVTDTVIVTARADPQDPPVVAKARERMSETPGAVAVVSAESYEGRHAPGLADMLRDVPGVYIQKKFGGDTRLSIRGSGIGNNNHLRGTLVAQDGIPLNEADGFGDTQMIDPFIARYTEVYKGGNALRYGGALLGGAINIITPTGKTMPEDGVLRLEGGDYGTLRAHADVGGAWGNWDAFGAVSGYTSDGWRQQSEGQWQFASGNVGYTFGDEQDVRAYVSGGHVHQEIPGTLSLQAALTTPELANATNVGNGVTAGNYQRDLSVQRGVVQTSWRLDANTVFAGGLYATHKELDHPIFQVIDQQSTNWGAFGRVDWEGDFLGMKSDLFYGLSYRDGENDAKQWVNLNGSKGPLTAMSLQEATGLDVFVEGRLFVLDGFALVAGGSYGRAERDYQSFAPSAVVVTDSETYDWFSPRVGFVWQNADGVQVYGNVTRSVEPPNFGGLAPTTGGFQPLQEQDAWTAEIGTRGRMDNFVWDVAIYRAEIENELLTFTTNPALGIPAPTFNALDGTRHQGLEAGLDWLITLDLRLRQTYMWSDFRFTGDRQYGDNYLPIVPQHFYRAELKWTLDAFWIAPSVEWSLEDTWVDYANTFRAPSYSVLNLNIGYDFGNGLKAFVDVRNIADEAYVSNFTPLVNWTTATAPGARNIFFPGDERSVYGGLSFAF
jgi:iron complex outermembrane receptor protein